VGGGRVRALGCPGEAGGVAVGRPAGGWLEACDSGRIAEVGAAGGRRLLEPLAGDDGAPIRLAIDHDAPGRFAIATARGRLIVYDAGRAIQRFDTPLQAWDLAFRKGRLALVQGDGALVVWDAQTGRVAARMRTRGAVAGWDDAGQLVVLGPDGARRWAIRGDGRPEVLRTGSGVSGLGLAPDGRRVAASLGDGRVLVFDTATGAELAVLPPHDAVAKDVAFSPDGAWLASVGAGRTSVRVYASADWREHVSLPLGGGRRLAWLRGGLLIATYADGLPLWDGVATRNAATPQFEELEANPGGEGAWALDHDDVLWRLDGAGVPTRSVSVPAAIGVAGVGEGAVVVARDAFFPVDAVGIVGEEVPLEVAATEIAAAPDGSLLAVGHVDGQVSVWRVGARTPVALLEGHRGWVVGLAFSTDGRWLYTGSWDESVRAWYLGELGTPPAALRAVLEADVGEPIDDAISRELGG
jgi:hypothetical protein